MTGREGILNLIRRGDQGGSNRKNEVDPNMPSERPRVPQRKDCESEATPLNWRRLFDWDMAKLSREQGNIPRGEDLSANVFQDGQLRYVVENNKGERFVYDRKTERWVVWVE